MVVVVVVEFLVSIELVGPVGSAVTVGSAQSVGSAAEPVGLMGSAKPLVRNSRNYQSMAGLMGLLVVD